MENLVTINLEYYNYLRDFEKAIKEGKIASTVSRSFIFNDSKHVVRLMKYNANILMKLKC